MEIVSQGFVVKFHGDRSVGIQDAEWKITGDFQFDSVEDKMSFQRRIVDAFEYCSDSPITVASFEEIAEQESKLK